MSLQGSQKSDYTFISTLGTGAYGDVGKFKHNPTGKVVAIKSYRVKDFDGTIPYHVLREICALKKVSNSSNCVSLLDVIFNPGVEPPMLVMEYCE